MLTQRLIDLSGNLGFEHQIVDPFTSIAKLFDQIDFNDFTCIVDLAGFFGKDIMSGFTDTPVLSSFHLSRLRVISSPKLDGSGFLLNLKRNQIGDIAGENDLSRTLILDDVSWSGRTVNEAMRALHIPPHTATIGLLSVNNGIFGEGKPGAKDLLEQEGSTVIAGSLVTTPFDDGFHLADFFNFSPIDLAFDRILEIQKIRESIASGVNSKDEGDNRIREILDANRGLLFPNALSSEELRNLEAEGKFIPLGGISKRSFFDTNPPNWLMPSFSKRTNWNVLQQNKKEITSVLKDFDDVMNEGKVIGEAETLRTGLESSIISQGGKERI